MTTKKPWQSKTDVSPPVDKAAGRNAPVNRDDGQAPAQPASTASEIADFLDQVRSLGAKTAPGAGRLIFAMDATMSRQPTWDMALTLQSEMFAAVRDIGGLDVQLVYFRGFGECRSSKFVSDPMELQRLMTRIECQGGRTQIGKVLSHARKEVGNQQVDALVFVGDAMEESVDELCQRAGELGLLGVPMFLFQEGYNASVERAFKEIARLTGGAWCRFDSGSAAQLRELLRAVAVYAAGGREALRRVAGRDQGAQLLLEQLDRRGT